MNSPTPLVNPVVRWASHPADQGRIKYIDGLWNGEPLPREGEVITRSFLVDPTTNQPVPVRVSQILQMWDADQQRNILAVVVARDQ